MQKDILESFKVDSVDSACVSWTQRMSGGPQAATIESSCVQPAEYRYFAIRSAHVRPKVGLPAHTQSSKLALL